MSQNNEQIEWYIARDGQQHGPLSQAELDKFVEFGHLKPNDLLWRAGFPDWRVASAVFQIPPPPPAVPVPPAPEVRADSGPGGGQAARRDDPASQAPASTGQGAVHGGLAADRRPAATSGQAHDPHDARATAGGSPQAAQGSASFFDAWQEAESRAGQRGGPEPAATRQVAQPIQQPLRHGATDDQAAARAEGPRPSGLDARTAATVGTLDDPAPRSLQADDRRRLGDDAYDDDDEDFDDYEYEEGGRSSWLGIAATILILGLIGAGGWFAYNNQNEIAALYADLVGDGKATSEAVEIVRAPEEATREAARGDGGSSGDYRTALQPAPNTVAPAANPSTTASISNQVASDPSAATLANVPLLKSRTWSYAEREFAAWTSKQLDQAREMAAANMSVTEINNFLVSAFVEFRRDNAALALLASPDRLNKVATAFVDSLKVLTNQGPENCYAFISSGEGTASLAPVYFQPAVIDKIDEQMLAIMGAIVDAKSNPSARSPPRAEDFDKLSGELNQRGWSDADLKLFSNPDALSRAKPEVVCRLVTEWFATQTTLADAEARDRLIAASLRPVIGG